MKVDEKVERLLDWYTQVLKEAGVIDKDTYDRLIMGMYRWLRQKPK